MRGFRSLRLIMLVMVSFGVSSLFLATFVSAGPGGVPTNYGYFYGSNYGPCTGPDICGAVLSGGIHSTSISDFISDIKYLHSNGSSEDRIGADFIIQLMRGGTDHSRPSSADITDWENLLRQPGISMRSEFASYGGYNSARAKNGTLDDRFYATSGGAVSLVFYQSGSSTPAFIVKEECGNPLGNLDGVKAQGWSLGVTSYVGIYGKKPYTTGNITAQVGDVIEFKHTVKNNGDGMATFNRWQMLSGAGGTSYTDGPHVNGATLAGNDSADYPAAASRKHTVTASQIGNTYCAKYAVDPRSSSNSAELDSTPVCYTVGAAPASSAICPVQGNVTTAYVSFGAGNNGEVTYSPSGWDKHYPPPGFPRNGDTYSVRYAYSYTAYAATVPNVGSVPVIGGNRVDFRPAINLYPYDTNTAKVYYTDNYYTYTYTYKVDSKGNGSWSSKMSGPSTSGSFDDGSATLGECNYRTFDIDPANLSASWSPNYEHPSSGSVTFSGTSTFGYNGPMPPRPPRSSSRVNGIYLGTNQVYIRHSDGSRINLIPSGSWYNFSYSGQTLSGSRSFAAPPSIRYGDRLCFISSARPGAGLMNQYGTITSVTVFENVADSEMCSAPLAARPYFRAFGGDVGVGGGVQQTNASGTVSTCSSTPGATINAWNLGSPTFAGSGGQYAVQALGMIGSGGTFGFSSNLANQNASPAASASFGPNAGIRPKGLTFANNTGGSYGGSFGAVPGCKDYVTDPPPSTEKLYGNQTIDGMSLGVVGGKGQHVTKYVYGDVFITGDITYGNSGLWTSSEQIPTFKLVAVGGSIYISPAVTQLDGMYVAIKAGATGGNIVTCANGIGSPMAGSQLFNYCADPLTVNGSFVANNVQLLRTRGQDGSNWQSNPNETPYSNYAAEIFNYTPEQWIAIPPSNAKVQYDAITSLGPVL